MISAQQELMRVLLDAVYARGLLSKTTYLSAVDLVHSALDIPPFSGILCIWQRRQDSVNTP